MRLSVLFNYTNPAPSDHRKPREIHQNQWKKEQTRVSKDPRCSLASPKQRVSKVLLGVSRGASDPPESPVEPGPPGSSWLLLASPGSCWLLLGPPGSSWLLLVLLGPPGVTLLSWVGGWALGKSRPLPKMSKKTVTLTNANNEYKNC